MHEKYILQTLESILNQKTNFHLEIIIINDNSSDNSHEIISSFLSKNHKNINWKYQYNSQNDGVSKNFKKALKESNGKYCAIIDGDDYWTDPFKLQKQVDFLETNESYSHCWTRFSKLDNRTKEITPDSNVRFFVNNFDGVDYSFETLATGWELGIQTLVFRRNLIDFKKFEKYKYFRDIHLITELLQNGKGYCLNFYSAVYRIHNGGVHSGISQSQRHVQAYKVYKEINITYRNNKFIMHEFKYYFTKLIEDKLKINRLQAFILIIEFYYYFADRNLSKHQIKQFFGLI
jgi:glycosyltransferase involved in cell wall biosynthesis